MSDAAEEQPEVAADQEETTVAEEDAASHTADTSDIPETQDSETTDAGQIPSAGTVSTRWKRKTTAPVGSKVWDS